MVENNRMRFATRLIIYLNAFSLALLLGSSTGRAEDGDEADDKDKAEAAEPEVDAASEAPTRVPAANKDAPPLAGWLNSIKELSGEFPRRLVFLRTLPEKAGVIPTFLPVDKAAFEELSYLHMANSNDVSWDMKLNKGKYLKTDPFTAVLQISRADTVVVAPEKGEWKILRKVMEERTLVYSGKGPAKATPEAITAWLFAAFNWDGVVLDQRGDYLLIGAMTKSLPRAQIQALAVSNSQDKFLLAKEERKGSGLLSLSEFKDGIGVFDIVVLGKDVSKIASGTKVIMEKK